jgi:hypothetical protein
MSIISWRELGRLKLNLHYESSEGLSESNHAKSERV